jgi:hypothetical protein
MHCLAKQAGLFVLAQGGIPNDELTRFMAARCGVVDAEISLTNVSGKMPSSVTDDQLFSSSRSSAEQMISKYLTSGNLAAGIWAGRDKGNVVIMLPFAPRRVQLDRVPVSPNTGSHVVITGEVLTPAESIRR